jgi:hypothetical protein
MEMQSHLDAAGFPITLKSLDDLYNKLMSPHAKVFTRLRAELHARHQAEAESQETNR